MKEKTFEIGEKVKITFYKKPTFGTIVKKVDNTYEVKHEDAKYSICYSISYLHKITE